MLSFRMGSEETQYRTSSLTIDWEAGNQPCLLPARLQPSTVLWNQLPSRERDFQRRTPRHHGHDAPEMRLHDTTMNVGIPLEGTPHPLPSLSGPPPPLSTPRIWPCLFLHVSVVSLPFFKDTLHILQHSPMRDETLTFLVFFPLHSPFSIFPCFSSVLMRLHRMTPRTEPLEIPPAVGQR